MNANTTPSYPLLSLKRISPNPRVRLAVVAGFGVLTVAEGYMFMRYWSGKKEGAAGQGTK